jgi:hypothetical protein
MFESEGSSLSWYSKVPERSEFFFAWKARSISYFSSYWKKNPGYNSKKLPV